MTTFTTSAEVQAAMAAAEARIAEEKARIRALQEEFYRLAARELRSQGVSTGQIARRIEWPVKRGMGRLELLVQDIPARFGEVDPGPGPAFRRHVRAL